MNDAESRLIGWENAIEPLNDTWDEYQATFKSEIERHIANAEAEEAALKGDIDEQVGNERGFQLLNIRSDIEQMKSCRDNFERHFERLRKEGLEHLSQSLLKQKKAKRPLGFTAARSEKNLIRAIDRKHPQKRGRKDITKRRHVKTGRPRGWNMRPYVQNAQRGGRKFSVRERREAHRAQRRQFRQEQRANNSIRAGRPLVRPTKTRDSWKRYPTHRSAKVDGWRRKWLDGKSTRR
jgi:hypothetical protein